MPSAFSHAITAVALGRTFNPDSLPFRFWVLSAGCAVLPDIDVMGRRFGIEYTDLMGHRGFTHSFLFAAIVSCLIVFLAFRKPLEGVTRTAFFVFFFLATASHGVLDAMVDGDLGVAFFAPFSAHRFFLPWRPVVSSPIGYGFFSSAGLAVLTNEFFWLWIPSLIVIFAPWVRNWFGKRDEKLSPKHKNSSTFEPEIVSQTE